MSNHKQDPRECKHYHNRQCIKPNLSRPCVFELPMTEILPLHCPDFTPKTDKISEP